MRAGDGPRCVEPADLKHRFTAPVSLAGVLLRVRDLRNDTLQ